MEDKSHLMEKQAATPSTWKTVGIRIRLLDLSILNKQLDRLNYVTLGDLAKDLIAGKITRLTDDQQMS